ncbi:O-antigen translocase [Flavobacterium eburneipallidum]|uniref:O-antigen translocase n=1 Tax=Flavobacterium eburneipallidum TaxID=3003263 RepID=UPI002482A047|nr:O-antigen translocase [Flavobacterium eburneipallidum]
MKNLKQNKLIKILSLNSISVVISFFLGIASTKIVSIFMGASGMALLGSFKNFTSMFKSMSTLGINNLVVKLVVENKEDKKELSIIYSTFFWIFLLFSVVLGSLILVFSKFIAQFLFFNDLYLIPIQFFGVLLPLVVVNVFWMAIYNGLEKFKKIVFIQILSNVMVFFITAFLVWKQNIFGGLLSVALSEFFLVLITFLFVRSDKSYFQFDLQRIVSKKYFDAILKFSSMALLSAVLVPLVLMLIRNRIASQYSINEAGIWDAVNKLSSFYMLIFSSGLSLYYMPKLATLKTDDEFKIELKSYFKLFVPLFLIVLIAVFFLKEIIIHLAFTPAFSRIKEVLIWQLLGDFFRIMTLAFGYQIVAKAMIKKYFILEITFNSLYLILSYYLIPISSFEGALQAYLFANLFLFVLILWMFRKLFFIPLPKQEL